MRGRAIIARGAPVDLPRSLALLPTYLTLAEIERRFLASIAFQSPRTASIYRDGVLRLDQFLAVARVDPFTSWSPSSRPSRSGGVGRLLAIHAHDLDWN